MKINGKSYRAKRAYGQKYVEMPVGDLKPGYVLDQGAFVSKEETDLGGNGAINPNTWLVRLTSGYSYVESRSAQRVRVWGVDYRLWP